MKKIFLLLPLAAIMACGGNEESETESTEESEEVVNNAEDDVEEGPLQIVEDLDNETFKNYLADKGGILIDVRTADEVAEGAIEGSINMDYTNGDFEAGIDTLNPATPVFVYCAAGGRSGNARDLLKDKGFSEIYNLKDGYSNWIE